MNKKLTTLICLFIIGLSLQKALAQVQGADCPNAATITALPFADPALVAVPPDLAPPNTCTSGNNFNNTHACNNTFTSANDFFYTYTPSTAADACIDISATTSNSDRIPASIFVIEGCPTTPGSYCVAQAIDQTPKPLLQSIQMVTNLKKVQLKVGVKYYIVISALDAGTLPNPPCFEFTFSVTRATACTIAPGDGCANADVVTALPYNKTNETTCNNTNYMNDGNSCGFTYKDGREHIYKFIPDKDYCARITLTTEEFYSSIMLYEGCPTNPNNQCIASDYFAFNTLQLYVNFIAGKEYYIVASSDTAFSFSGTDCYTYDLDIDFFSSDTGKNCSLPFDVTSLPFNNTNTTACKGDDFDNVGGCTTGTFYQQGDEIVYKYVSPGDECISIEVDNQSTNFTTGVVSIFDRCPELPGAVCLGSDYVFSFGGKGYVEYTFTGAQTVYIAISTFNTANPLDFDITIKRLDLLGKNCTNPIIAAALPFNDINSTACKGDDFDNIACTGFTSFYQNGREAIYTYDSPGNECLGIKLKNMTVGGGVFVFDRCPESPGAVCLASGTGFPSFFPPAPGFVGIDYTVVAPQTLYIAVSNAYNDESLDYELEIEKLTDIGRDCANPINITSVPFQENNSVLCKGDDFDTTGNCPTSFRQNINGNEVVYTYNSPGSECISLTVKDLTTDYSTVYIFDQCPTDPSAQCIASDFRYPFFGGKTGDYQFELISAVPQTYYIIIGAQFLDENPDYTIIVNADAIDPAGITCNLAIPVTTLPFGGTYNIACKGNDYNSTTGCASPYTNGNDLVLKYVVPTQQCVSIVAKMNNRGGIFVTDNCPDAAGVNCLVSGICEGDCDSVVLEYTFNPGTYYITIDGFTNVLDMTVDLQIRLNGNPLAGAACKDCDDEDICLACKNAGLEHGTLADWIGAYGDYTTPNTTAGITFKSVNDPTSRHTVVSSGSYDPVVGPELNLKSPAGSRYAVRLGNRSNGAEAEVLRYSYTVDANSKNFYYYYAVVFDDPGHGVGSNPYLLFRMFDELNQEIQCARYEVYADDNIEGFKKADLSRFQEYNPDISYYNQNIIWKNWTLVAVPLDAYIGRTVTIEFTTKDCSATGHFGYCYLDAFCGDLPFLTTTKFLCKGQSVDITAPPGFNGYLWDTGETTQTITVTEGREYTCTVTTVANCTLDIKIDVKEGDLPLPDFSTNQLCQDATLRFNDNTDFAVTDTSNTASITWNFGDGTPSVTELNPTHTFAGGPGNYAVTMTVLSTNECSASITKTVNAQSVEDINNPIALDSIKVCENSDVQLTATATSSAVYSWSGPKGFSSNIREPLISNIQPDQTGFYQLEMTVPFCPLIIDTIYVDVTDIPVLTPPNDTTLCDGSAGINLVAAATGSGIITYQWRDAAIGGNLLATTATYKTPILRDSTTYYVSAAIKNCVVPAMPVTVNINPLPAKPASPNISLCQGLDTLLTATLAKGTVEWYDAESGGNLLAKSNTYRTPKLSTSTNYYVRGLLNGCYGSTQPVAVTAKPKPVDPTVAPISICSGEDTVLTATNVEGTIRWFSTAAATGILSNTNTLTTPALYTNTSYYVQNSNKGCNSILVEAPITVINTPAAKIATEPQICVGADTVVTATATVGSISWYDAPKNGTVLATGNTFRTAKLSSNAIYYAEANNSGCISPREAAKVLVFPVPESPKPYYDKPVCEGSTFPLRISKVQEGTYKWTGPNGFQSTQRSPYINGVSLTDAGMYTVQVQNNGCPSPAVTIRLDITPKDDARFIYSDSLYCLSGGNAPATILGTLGGAFRVEPEGGVVFSNNTGWINLAVSQAGTYNVYYATKGVCFEESSKRISLVSPNSIAFEYPANELCAYDDTLSPIISVSGNIGAFSYTPTGLDLNPLTGRINPMNSKPNIYIISNSLPSVGKCPKISAKDTIEIVATPPTPIVSANNPCEGETLELTVENAANWGINWTLPNGFSSTKNTLVFNKALATLHNGTYYVAFSNRQCIGSQGSTKITIPKNPVAEFGIKTSNSDKTATEGSEVVFSNLSKFASNYQWNFGDGKTSTEPNPKYVYNTPGVYTVVLKSTNSLNCLDSSLQKITVSENVSFLFNNADAFSPNGDGKNDEFQVVGRSVDRYHLEIFNRWGERMFESKDISIQWDGKCNGVLVPYGTYVYSIIGYDLAGKPHSKIGKVSVTY